MKYFHDCGGIHAPGPAWDEFGWECVGISEIEKFPIAVVQHHYPNIPQYGDTTKIKGSDLPRINLLVGGTPCQGFSVAGKRGGLDDERSNLALNFLRLAAECNPQWIIWENVPGASSTNEGLDLLAFVTEVGKLGYGFAWRTLDAQYFGVPQRRRRIFLVGYFGDWRPAAAVLFESQSLRGHSAPSRNSRKGTAPTFEIGPSGNRVADVSPTLDARCKDGPIRNQVGLAVAHTLLGKANDSCDHTLETYIFENHAQDSRIRQVELCPQLNAKDGTGENNLPLVFDARQNRVQRGSIRRLTPNECARLQGFPDDWCKIPWRKKPAELCPDGPQYKAIGNSIAVPVLKDLGRKITIVERLLSLTS